MRLKAIRSLCLACSLFLTGFSHADNLPALEHPIISLNQGNVFSVSQFSAYTKDTDGTQTLEEIVQADTWKMSQVENLNFGFADSAYWIAAKIEMDSADIDWFLRVEYALFDNVQTYLCPTNKALTMKNCEHSIQGDQFPFNQREIPHPEFISKLPVYNAEPFYLFIRFKTMGSYPLMIKIEDESNLRSGLLIDAAIRGGYISMMLVMGLYNLFLFFSTKSRSYLYYSAFVITFMGFHATYSGTAFQFLWPNLPQINDYALPVLLSINMATLTLFIPKFLNLRRHSRKSFYLFRFYLAISIAFIFLSFVAPYQIVSKYLNILNIIFTISALVISATFWAKGHTIARFFTIAWIALIIGLIMAASRSLGLIPLNVYTFNGFQLGSFIEIILLSLALGERITQLQKDKENNKKALFESQEESIANLKRYENLYENSISGQFQLNDQKEFIKMNTAWSNIIYKHSSSHLENMNGNFNQCFTEDADADAFWSKIESEERISSTILRLKKIDCNDTIYIDLSMRKGNDSAWVGSAQNISEKYRQEEALKQLQVERNQSLRQLVMGISHEMNTPLGNIKVAQTFLKDQLSMLKGDKKETFTDGLAIVEEGTCRLEELGGLMKSSIASEKVYKKEYLNIHQWMQDWSDALVKSAVNLNIKIDSHDPQFELETLPEALTDIMNQLSNNSITHNSNLYRDNALNVTVTISYNSDTLSILYHDNGVGLEKELRDSIFQPFYTTQRQQAASKGLGMYHTFNLITEVLNGNIQWPENANGFELTIILPIQTD